jgi:phage gp29-like protein
MATKRQLGEQTAGFSVHTEEFRELPVTAAPVPQNARSIDAALRDLEAGYFQSAAQLCDTILRDDRIMGCLTTRLNGLLGLPFKVKPAYEDDAQAQAIADEIDQNWDTLFPNELLAEIKRWGILVGAAPVEVVWETRDEDPLKTSYRWWPRLKCWHPQFMFWDPWARAYHILQADGNYLTIEPGTGVWAMYTPHGYERAWLFGLIRCLGQHWLRRAWGYRDFSRKSEINGQAIRLAIVPAQADKEAKNRFFTAVANLGAETTLRVDQDSASDGPKYDLKLIEAQTSGHDIFVKLLEKTETNIAIALLGQNLSTEVQGGSYAAATAHEQIRADFKRFDALSMAEFLREQVLKPWAAFNYNDPQLAPFIEWQTDPPEDAKNVADATKAMAEAVTQFVNASAPVDLRALLEEAGVPVLDEADVQAAPSKRHPQTIGGTQEEPAPEEPAPETPAPQEGVPSAEIQA